MAPESHASTTTTKRPSQQGGSSSLVRSRPQFPQMQTFDPFEIFSSGPFSFMRRMHDEMDRMLNQSSLQGSSSSLWAPVIEVSERDGNLIVSADLPGINENDVHVEIDDNMLVIEGERKSEEEKNEGGIHRSERSYGRFYRTIPLAEGVNPEQAQAEFKNGVLRVTVPMPQQKSKARNIPIQSSGTSGTGSKTIDSKKAA
jgi:HSP20 family protein